MLKKIILLLSFFALPTILFADLDINSLEIGGKEPINEPISGYDNDTNSYPDPFSEDQIFLHQVKLKCLILTLIVLR